MSDCVRYARARPLYTDVRATWEAVTIMNNIPGSVVGSNDKSGTVQVHATNVSLYNLNIANTYGKVRH